MLETGDQDFNCCLGEGLQHELGIPPVHGWKRRFDHPSLYHSQVLLITWLFGLFYALSLLESAAFGTFCLTASRPEDFSLLLGVEMFYACVGNGRLADLSAFACVI